MRGQQASTHGDDYMMGWELFGRRALRVGDWKVVFSPKPYGDDIWRLFDLASDPGEVHDLAEQQPQKLADMIELWDQYAAENNIVLQTEFSPY